MNDKKSLKIINVARLTDQKDHLTLLMAVKKLSKFIKCKLVIIGRGYKEKKLRKYILENNLQKIVKISRLQRESRVVYKNLRCLCFDFYL